MVCVMGGKWPYSSCFVGCCLQDLLKIGHSILVWSSFFFSMRFVSVDVVHQQGSIDSVTAWKEFHSVMLKRLDFHWTDNVSIAFHVFATFSRRDTVAVIYQFVD